jgi:predicted secreted protein
MADTDKIKGRDCVIRVKSGATYYTVACARSCEASFEMSLLRVTDVDSGPWARYISEFRSGGVTGSGLIQLNSPVNAVTLLTAIINGSELDVQFKIDAIGTGWGGGVITGKTISFKAIMTNLTTNGTYGEPGTHSFKMVMSGGPTIT